VEQRSIIVTQGGSIRFAIGSSVSNHKPSKATDGVETGVENQRQI